MTDNSGSDSTKIDAGLRMPLKDRVRLIIFEAHTPAGKAFDVGLIICILVSVLAVLLDSVIYSLT